MQKRLLAFAILIVFCCFFLGAISVRETNLALSSTLDGVISAVASVASNPRVPLQGVDFEFNGTQIPKRITFTRSDLSSFLSSLTFNAEDRKSWYETLLRQPESSFDPIKLKAISYLENSNYERGSVILDGMITIKREESVNLNALVSSSSWSGVIIPISLSLMISGSSSSPLIIEGDIEIIGGDESKITVYSENLAINGEVISFSPFEISY